MYPNHFLDSNIFIGSKIEWDTHNPITTLYMNRIGITRYMCPKVFDESKKVLHAKRKIIKNYLESLSSQNFFGSRNDIKAKIDRFTNLYTSILTEYQANVVESFKNLTVNDIINEIEKDTVDGVENYYRYAINKLNRAITSLANDCGYKTTARIQIKHVPMLLPNYYTDLEDKIRPIVINNDDDVTIIVQSYYIKNEHLQIKNASFVTADGDHFLNPYKKIEIEKELNDEVHIQAPNFNLNLSPTIP